jgi:hypothetical protein
MSGQIYRLTVRIEAQGGAVADRVYALIPRPAPVRRLMIFVHGYNNSMNTADKSFTNFHSNLCQEFGIGVRKGSSPIPDVAYFFWPGDDPVWRPVTAYARSINNARRAAELLVDFLQQLGARPALDLYLIGHSMGCRLILEMFSRVETPAGFPTVRLAALMAGAVPTDLVAAGQAYRRSVRRLSISIAAFHSTWDLVLHDAFRGGQFAARISGIEDRYYGRAIGYYGVPLRFARHRQEMIRYGHSNYWPSRSVASEVGKLMGLARPYRTPLRIYQHPLRGAARQLAARPAAAARPAGPAAG